MPSHSFGLVIDLHYKAYYTEHSLN